MTEAEEREAVVREALSWLGTPYHANADIKGAGCDCGMLLVRVYVDCGLIAPFDPRPYPNQWHLHQRAERYMDIVKTLSREMDQGIEPGPGDIVLFHYGHCYAHGGIVTRWPEVVHAMGPSPIQRESVRTSGRLLHLRRKYFTVWPRSAT
jgi:cell wall-associated NlpC family hydrolase